MPTKAGWGKVNPYIETARGRYFYFVTGSLPFGMISSAPLTRNKNQYGGGYNYNSQEVLGFPQLHDWMMSGRDADAHHRVRADGTGRARLEVGLLARGRSGPSGIPQAVLGTVSPLGGANGDRQGQHVQVHLLPGHWAVGCPAEPGRILGNNDYGQPQVRKVSDRELSGSVYTVGRLWGRPRQREGLLQRPLQQAYGDAGSLDGTRGGT